MSDTSVPTKSRRGGARVGAGRPSRSVRYKSVILEAEKKITDALPIILDDLMRLSHGAYSETRIEQEPAGHLYRDDYETYEVEVKGIVQQRYKRIKVPIYPNLPPDQMVVTKHVETNFSPDRNACMYLLNRIMGTPQAISDEELSLARTLLALQQAQANVFDFQAAYLAAQAEGKRIENELVPKQFVSEEEEREHIQTLLLALNRPLLHMTPEKAAEFGISPDQLEDLKGYLGVSQAAVIEEVFEGKAEDVLDEDDDETSEED